MGLLDIMTELSLMDWILIVVGIVILLYVVGTWKYDHFTKRGIQSVRPPLPFMGNLTAMLFKRKSLADFVTDMYNSHKGHKIMGLFEFTKPLLMVKDPDVIKLITVKDFEHFMDHRTFISEDVDPIFGNNLVALTGQKWRDMRATLSPSFTSSKMKAMFLMMSECGEQMADDLERKSQENRADDIYSLDFREYYRRLANDIIATTAFGVKCDSFKAPKNEFYMMGNDIVEPSTWRTLVFLGFSVCPKLMKWLNISFFDPKVKNFFESLVRETISTREREGIVRPDMIHLLMQARKGELKAEPAEEDDNKEVLKEAKHQLTEMDIASQAVIFFLAGFDTVSTGLSFATHLLASHTEVQERLQREIDALLEEHGSFTYEGVLGMKYLDSVVNEALRMYPPAMLMDRKCVKDYVIPASGNDPSYTLKKEDGVWIPVYGLHHDPELFPDPEKFDPDRFSDDNKHKIKPFSYLPFGSGPRSCIANRFALMEVKVGLVHLLSRFNLHTVEKTKIPIEFSKVAFSIKIEGGFWLGVSPRVK